MNIEGNVTARVERTNVIEDRPANVTDALNAVEESIETLGKLVQLTIERLQPVLRDSGAEQAAEAFARYLTPSGAGQCVQRLFGDALGLVDLAEALARTLDRLEV